MNTHNISKKQQTRIGLLLLVLLTTALLAFRYQEVLKNPNHYLNVYADGMKNYATVIYHVKHDSTYWHYGGMNYPYGDHIVFADGQPLISNSLKFIHQNIVDVGENIVAVVNLSMIFSFLLCSVFLFLMFRKLNLPVWYCILVAIGMTFLCRQNHKIFGHYGLAHAFVIPMIIYLLYLFEQKRSWGLSLGIGLAVTLVANLHFYFFGISFFMIGLYALQRMIVDREKWKIVNTGLHLLLQLILPFILLQIILHIGETPADRPAAPTGFLTYKAHYEGIFTSLYMPYWEWFDENVIKIRTINAEGLSYIGLTATLFTITLVGRAGYAFFKKRKLFPNWQSEHRPFLMGLFVSTGVILALSLGLPFALHKSLHPLLDFTGPYQQFRGIGRFAWAFYFGFNIVVFYSLYRFAKKSKWRKVILFAALGLLLYDAWHFSFARKIKPEMRHYLESDFIKDKGNWFETIDIHRYQAVLPIPHYHLGSENFQLDVPGYILALTLAPGMHTGIPNLGVAMSRTSYGQTLKNMQLAYEPYRPLAILDDLPNDKPFLLVYEKEQAGKEEEKYKGLLKKAFPLLEEKRVAFYELPLNAFQNLIAERIAQIQKELKGGNFYPHDNFLYSDSVKTFLYVPEFQQTTAQNRLLLFKGQLPNAVNNQKTKLSFWMDLSQDGLPLSVAQWREYDRNTQEVVQEKRFSIRNHIKTMDENGWALFEETVQIKHPENELELTIEAPKGKDLPIEVKKLLVLPAQATIYQKEPLMKNNRWW